MRGGGWRGRILRILQSLGGDQVNYGPLAPTGAMRFMGGDAPTGAMRFMGGDQPT